MNKGATTLEDLEWCVKSKETTVNVISKITTEPFSYQLFSANGSLKYGT